MLPVSGLNSDKVFNHMHLHLQSNASLAHYTQTLTLNLLHMVFFFFFFFLGLSNIYFKHHHSQKKGERGIFTNPW